MLHDHEAPCTECLVQGASCTWCTLGQVLGAISWGGMRYLRRMALYEQSKKNYGMKRVSGLALCLIFSSCVIQISSTKNTYEHTLSEQGKARVSFVGHQPHFELSTAYDACGESKRLFLLNGQQLRADLADKPWSIIYSHLPYCKGEHCISIPAFVEQVRGKANSWVVLRNITSDRYVAAVDDFPLVGMDYRYYRKALCEKAFETDLLGSKVAYKEHRYKLFYLFRYDQIVASSDSVDVLLQQIASH